MNRLQWIVKEIYRDLKKNGKTILKWIGYSLLVIGIMKLMLMVGIDKKMILIGTYIAFALGMLFSWYSMSYDREQKDIIRKLKGKK